MEEDKIKIIEKRVKNLMLSKQLIIQTLIVIAGGTIGLLFMPNTALRNVFIFIGVLFAVALIKSFQSIDSEVNGYLYGKRR